MKVLNLGVAAHITAASEGGPRFNASLTEEQRSGINNGIWLCQNCAKLVDNDSARYSEDILRSWKQTAEQRTLESIGKTSPTLSSGAIIDEIREVPKATAELIVEQFREVGLGAPNASQSALGIETAKALQVEVVEALERDLVTRYDMAFRRAMFPEFSKAAAFEVLAQEITTARYAEISQGLRRRIFLRAARSSAVRKNITESLTFLAHASNLSGNDSEIPALARVAEAQDDIDGAIRMLRDQRDSDCRSVLLHILLTKRGADAALAWFAEQGLLVSDLTANGVTTLVYSYLQNGRIVDARDGLNRVTDDQLAEGPYLLFCRGAFRLACLFSEPDRGIVLQGLPVIVPSIRTAAPESVVIEELDASIGDWMQFLPIASQLGLRDAKRIAQGYLFWCELLHPRRKSAGLTHLRTEMVEPGKALPQLQFAFAYDPDFDPSEIAQYLEKHERLGGLDDDELRAMLVLRLHGNDPKAVADLIAKYRARFENDYQKAVIVSIEIQALAQAGDVVSAKLLLESNSPDLPHEMLTKLEAEISKAQGADPVVEDLRVYETTKKPEALRSLVATLISKRDYRAIARYAEELYQYTGDPQDVTAAAQASANMGDSQNFIRLVETHAFLRDNQTIKQHYAWELFRSGRLKDAKSLADELRGTQSADVQLEIAIAIETGEWEMLAQPLTTLIQEAESLDGPTLIQGAYLAQASGHGPMLDLMKAAVQKGGNDAHVLLGAYTLILEESLEDDFPESQQWFSRALDLSGKEGPVKRFELKDLLAQQLEWNERVRKINDLIVSGDAPLILAAPALHTTLVDIVLRNLVRNTNLNDARKRVAVPLFAGSRTPKPIGETKRIALDISAILVLGWLRLLPNVLQNFTEVVLPAGVLSELFEARRRVRETQRSRITRATEIQHLIATSRIKVLPSSATALDAIANEVGIDFARLIRAAESVDGVILRPAPLYKPGLEQLDADVTPYTNQLCDMHSFLNVLVDLGAIDQTIEETARRYFSLQDRGWPSSAKPDVNRPLFLDDVALTYLQTTNLLSTVLDKFREVWIDSPTHDNAVMLIEHDQNVSEVLGIIDTIRNSIRAANKQGKVTFGSQLRVPDEDKPGRDSSTLRLLTDFVGAEAVVFDDRAFNKEPFAQDQTGNRVLCLTSLDILEELRSRGQLSEQNWRGLRHRLRAAGAVLVPLDGEEVVSAVTRSGKTESAEFRAIRHSIELARVREIPHFPKDIPWFMSINLAVKAALFSIWNKRDTSRTLTFADAVLELRPRPEDWVARWGINAPPNWVEVLTRLGIASLAMPSELSDDEVISAYNDWLEQRLLAPLRSTTPDRYAAIVDLLKTSIVKIADQINEEKTT